ncbi:MAG: NAD(P)H-dependent oxidoreductase [Angelakisella sp.]
MKILVLNGSPKGAMSITLQTVRYLAQCFPTDSFETLHVGRDIKKYERDFAPALTALNNADLILFAYPVYTFLVPYQLHRFLELLKASGADLQGKLSAQISTSKHFYHITAHRFIAENCGDMGLAYLGGLSADMDDLLTEKGRLQATDFWERLHFCAANDLVQPPCNPSIHAPREPYKPVLSSVAKKDGYTAVILTDSLDPDGSIAAMIEDFTRAFPYQTKVVALAEFPFKGGCLGCFHCASNGTCVYSDGFDAFLRREIQSADAIIYAFAIRDHSMGATFKLYDDRQFCNGHRTVTMGKPVGYLMIGDYFGESNLQTVVNGRSEVGQNFLAGVVSDKGDRAQAIQNLVLSLSYALLHKTVQPQNFYGVGGAKIFRDLIFTMRGLMREDHRFYKAHGFYDFPQKQWGTILKMQVVGALLAVPSVQKKMGGRMNAEIIKPYEAVIRSVSK